MAAPSDFLEVPEFPETRSGKYMRRMVRAIIEGGDVGDVTTLRNPRKPDRPARGGRGLAQAPGPADEQKLFERYRYFLVQYNTAAKGRRVATVMVNNPPVNALNERAIDELATIVEHLARKDDVAAVVFTGSGSSSFVAGADIRQMLEEVNTVSEANGAAQQRPARLLQDRAHGQAVHRRDSGRGLGRRDGVRAGLPLCVAEPRARFGQPEINLRLLPGYGGTQRLPRLLADRRGEAGLPGRWR